MLQLHRNHFACFLSRFFYSFTGITTMSLPCPYCQSRETVQLQSTQHLPSTSTNNPISNSVMSPMALATLGVSVSKSLNIPPIAGAIVGVLIGGIWMLITEDEQQQPLHPTYRRQYYCNHCDRSFSPNLRN
jgi:DNA-directed RNA polymerase subunit RPC12/RpoP